LEMDECCWKEKGMELLICKRDESCCSMVQKAIIYFLFERWTLIYIHTLSAVAENRNVTEEVIDCAWGGR
jgi:hypothetical protein